MELPAVWGVYSISKELFDCIGYYIPSGSTVLEFGSGFATGELCKKYSVISIEDDERFLNLYPTHYVYAGRTRVPYNWYDMDEIKKSLTMGYDAVLVDGNSDDGRLKGLIANSDFFNWDIPWFFDDLNITTINIDFENFIKDKLKRPFIKYMVGPKPWGVILPKNWTGTIWEPNEIQA